MPDNIPKSTARGAYLLRDLDMGRMYRCHRCGQVSTPYMVLVRGKLFLPYCSFGCAMFIYVRDDMKAKTDMIFQGTNHKAHLRLVAKQPLSDVVERRDQEMNLSRDVYLIDKVLESGVDIERDKIPNLSSWDGFGFLFKWAFAQGWWEEFAKVEYEFGVEMGSSMPVAWVDPCRFADELFGFL